jgi:hypothetical protein
MSALAVLGVVLVLALIADVALTVFPSDGRHGGPVHHRQNLLLWALYRRLGTGKNGVARPKVLSLAGPAGALSTLLLWCGTSTFESGAVDAEVARSRWAEEWARSLLRITDAHGKYPLLHFFRPADADRSLLVQLAWLLPLAGVHPSGDGPRSTLLPTHAAEVLRQAIERYLQDLNHGCVPHRFRPIRPRDVSLHTLYARLLRHLCYDPAEWEVRPL